MYLELLAWFKAAAAVQAAKGRHYSQHFPLCFFSFLFPLLVSSSPFDPLGSPFSLHCTLVRFALGRIPLSYISISISPYKKVILSGAALWHQKERGLPLWAPVLDVSRAEATPTASQCGLKHMVAAAL